MSACRKVCEIYRHSKYCRKGGACGSCRHMKLICEVDGERCFWESECPHKKHSQASPLEDNGGKP